MESHQVCLVMVVHNNSDIIKGCLDSVRDLIDYWVIYDLGSQDHTRKLIKNFSKKYKIPGELLTTETTLIDRSVQRNHALGVARERAKYLLLMEPNWQLALPSDFKGTIPNYGKICILDQATGEDIPIIIDASLPGKYIGAAHEYFACDSSDVNMMYLSDNMVLRPDLTTSVQSNISILEAAVETDPMDARSWFYLGKNLYQANKWSEAKLAFSQYQLQKTDDKYEYLALYYSSMCSKQTGEDFYTYMGNLMRAWEIRPERLEALYEILHYYRHEQKKYAIGYQMGMVLIKKYQQTQAVSTIKELQFATVPVGVDQCFRQIYEWRIWDELALCAYHHKQYKDAVDIYSKIVKENKFPAQYQTHIKNNYAIAVKGLTQIYRTVSKDLVIVTLETDWNNIASVRSTIESLKNQTYPQIQINLCVSNGLELPLDLTVDKSLHVIKCPINYGQCTALLGTLEDIDAELYKDQAIVVVQAGQVYETDMISKLVAVAKTYPDAAVGLKGWNQTSDVMIPFQPISAVNILDTPAVFRRRFFDNSVFDFQNDYKYYHRHPNVWYSKCLAKAQIARIVTTEILNEYRKDEKGDDKFWQNDLQTSAKKLGLEMDTPLESLGTIDEAVVLPDFMQGVETDNICNVSFNAAFENRSVQEIGIVIPVYDRPQYLEHCLQSLYSSNLNDSVVILVDDDSQQKTAIKTIIDKYTRQTSVPTLTVWKHHNTGKANSLQLGWDILTKTVPAIRYLAHLDADTIVRYNWAIQSKKTWEHAGATCAGATCAGACVVTGFKYRDNTSEIERINTFFAAAMYPEIRGFLTDTRWNYRWSSYMRSSSDRQIVCTEPSVVQHIGKSTYGPISTHKFRYATDFYDVASEHYIYIPFLDSPGNDMSQAKIANVTEFVKTDHNVAGFNSNGWLKHELLSDLEGWDVFDIDNFKGTFVSYEYAKRLTPIGAYLV